MKNESILQKNNIIFFFLLFFIPILALNASYYFLAKLDLEWERKEQEKYASLEAEILASEADFSNQISMLFKRYCDVVKSDLQIRFADKTQLEKHLHQTANIVFQEPFPKYNIHIFQIPFGSKSAELVFTKGDNSSSKKGLCFAFEYLYNRSLSDDIPADIKSRESFLKNIVGQYSDIDSISRELRGSPTFACAHHNSSWFIWDYAVVPGKGIVGAILTCSALKNHENIGRMLALRNLRLRGRATGAFIPVYHKFGDAMFQHPLEKSYIFRKWADSIVIHEEKNLEKWLNEDLPQGVQLGKYTAFSYLERGASHIAVVLVKSLGNFAWPKWLIALNLFLVVAMVIIIFIGLGYEKWPSINLRARFILSYILASILPLCLLSVTAYGYLLQYRNTAINQATNDLQATLKTFDSNKAASLNGYKNKFTKALSDPMLIQLIKENGINDKRVAKRAVDIFENDDYAESLPVLGITVFDEAGDGSFAKGSAPSILNVENFVKSFLSAYIYTLRAKIKTEDPDANSWMKPFEATDDNDLAGKAYQSLTGYDIKVAMNKHASVPFTRKNGNFCSLQIFDFIKIDGKTRYVLFVVWDDRTLDDRILQSSLDNYALKNQKQSFMGLRIKGQNVEYVGKKTRHASQKTISKATELAKLVGNSKRAASSIDDDTLIVAIPATNFSQTVLVGWISLFDVAKGVWERQLYFGVLLIISIIILTICSFRSVGVFLMPVTSLKKALDEVSAGNLNVALESNVDNELGKLSNEFAAMIEGLREKERLSKLISDQAVQALQKRGDELLNDTETFDGVALVSDIRNFTGISEENDPMVITDLLNEHFAEMTKVISDNGGLIYKFIGDAIEAVFPEGKEFKKPGIERAFRAGCMMIATLVSINNKRRKRGLFPYRMGVGLCKGIMHSGSVGSFETRLDYAIIGDALKKAAKFEALSVQNSAFPLVIDENIAEKLSLSGFSFRKLDSKGENFAAFTVDQIGSIEQKEKNLEGQKPESSDSDNTTSKEKQNELQIYSLQNTSVESERRKTYFLTISFIVLLILCFVLGVNTLFFTKLELLKTESNQECSRLIEQLNNNDVLSTAFEALCLEFSEKIRVALNNKKDDQTMSEIMKPIKEHFENLGRPMPYYFCCHFRDKNKSILSDTDISYHGFSDAFALKIASIPISIREDRSDEEHDKYIQPVMGNTTSAYNLRSSHFRRSQVATVDGSDMIVETNRFLYYTDGKGARDFFGYCFFAMPTELNVDDLKRLNYYSLLAGKNCMLAFNNGNDWVFSDNFTQKEKDSLKRNFKNDKLLIDKGYSIGNMRLGQKVWTIYAVSQKINESYYSAFEFNSYLFAFIILILIVLFNFLKKWLRLRNNSVAGRLKVNLVTAAILPLLTVGFVSYLYVNEDYNVKKAEKRAEIQRKMDIFESRDLYFHPFCTNFLNEICRSEELYQFALKVNNADNEQDKKDNMEKIRHYISDKLTKSGSKLFRDSGLDPHFTIQEVIVFGKKDWALSVLADESREKNSNGISDFGRLLYIMSKLVYLDMYKTSDSKNNVDDVKSELVVGKMLDTLSTTFGNNASLKILNFPYNPVLLSVTYTTISSIMYPLPNQKEPEFVIMPLVFFNNEKLTDYCSSRNEVVPIKQHIASGSIGEEVYLFTCPYNSIGRFLFRRMRKEDLRTVNELLPAASWVYASNLPVSRTVDLNGLHYLEARPGNIIGDTIFISLTSDVPVKEKVYANIPRFGLVMLFSIVLIYFIAQSIVSGLLSPIDKLIAGAKSAERGIYSYRSNYHSGDEFGALCNSFDKMMKGLEEKQLMNRMVSKTALNVASGVSDSSSKRVDTFLLYVTVPGFNEILHNVPPEELFRNLKRQIARISEIVLTAGGDIDKIMGEKMLIAFHIHDKKPEEVALAACNAAYAIETDQTLFYKVAVGVNYGQVISGFLGVGEKRDFTVIGDPVNVAARIATLAEKQEFTRRMISEPVKKFVDGRLNFEKFGEVSLKGKSELLAVYRIS